MKKTLLLAAVLLSSLSQLSAQCTIVPGCSTAATGYCSTPSNGANLPNAMVSSAYSTTIQVSIASAFGGVTVSSANITSVTGLPTGLSYSVNPTSGVIVGGSNGCIRIAGTPAVGTTGTYTVVANATIASPLGPVIPPVSMNWILTVNPPLSTGITASNLASNFYIAPNPVSSELFISNDTHLGKVAVIDALGKIVLSLDANYSNQTTINVNSLIKGVYFIQANDGERIITKKFIKD
jgi:hypothetical protein